jgi:hypothetical protein
MIEFREDATFKPKLKKTKEGYLKGTAYISKFNNVQRYFNSDGSERLEFRPKDEVLKQEALDSLKGIVITCEHPRDSFVDCTNVDKFTVGYTGESIVINENKVGINLTITHKDAIAQIQRGKRGLSVGYTLSLKREDGVFEGKKYTHIQENISANHLSIVQEGNAGPDVKINTDSMQEYRVDSLEFEMENEEVNMDSVQENEVKEVVEDKVEEKEVVEDKVEDKAEEKVEAVVATNTDSLESAIKNLNSLVEKLTIIKNNNDSDKGFQEAVFARCNLLDNAKRVMNVDKLHDKSDRFVMEEVLKSKDKTLNLDGKSEDYVKARFDLLIESVKKDPIKKQIQNLDSSFYTKNTDIKKEFEYEKLSLNDIIYKKQQK